MLSLHKHWLLEITVAVSEPTSLLHPHSSTGEMEPFGAFGDHARRC